jgi:hypothetical protein
MAKPSFEGNHLVQKMPEYFLLAGGISPSNTVISNLASDTEVPKLHAKRLASTSITRNSYCLILSHGNCLVITIL